jgi:hypothetical protein
MDIDVTIYQLTYFKLKEIILVLTPMKDVIKIEVIFIIPTGRELEVQHPLAVIIFKIKVQKENYSNA